MSLSSSPSSPMSLFFNSSELMRRVKSESHVTAGDNQIAVSVDPSQSSEGGIQTISLSGQDFPISNVLPSGDLGCTHLWLQSRVPLGSVPAQFTATIKLEVLPLTDGIIPLDSLQIGVKEKGRISGSLSRRKIQIVAKEGGEKWKSMTEEEKQLYVEKAAELQVEYERALESHNDGVENEDNEEDEKKVKELIADDD